MPSSEARVRTEKAGRYLDQLCKHFSHKIPAQWEASSGRLEFDMGTCRMEVEREALVLCCEAEDQADLQTVKTVVGDHLVRFAWREDLAIEWSNGP
ncbi:DUF2218 domain-containing protein [Fodinicurvata halophila]|uniref:DUF2218 domain-containing protein n=1 Tax=Fodinicurvata halophila TaxID=1419723 RepID=A0ABV8UHJ0_9PROT